MMVRLSGNRKKEGGGNNKKNKEWIHVEHIVGSLVKNQSINQSIMREQKKNAAGSSKD